MKHQGEITRLGTTSSFFFDNCVGSLTSPVNHVRLKMKETAPFAVVLTKAADVYFCASGSKSRARLA